MTPNAVEERRDLRDVLAILRHQFRLIYRTALAMLGLTTLYVTQATPLYTATALIRVNPQDTNLLDPGVSVGRNAAVETSRIDTEVEVLRSSRLGLLTVEQAGLLQSEEFGPQAGLIDAVRLALGIPLPPPEDGVTLAARTLDRFSTALDVRRKGITYLVAVTVTSEDPKQAAHLANTHARIYIDDQVASRVQAAAMASEVLRDEVAKAAVRLADKTHALRDYVAVNLDRLSAEANSDVLSALNVEFQASARRLALHEEALTAVTSAAEKHDWFLMQSEVADRVAAQGIAALLQDRQAFQDRLQGAGEAPTVERDLEAELARIDAALEQRADAAVRALKGSARQERQNQDVYISQIQQALADVNLSGQTLGEVYALNQNAVVAQRQYDQLLNRLQDFEAQAVVQVADSQLASVALPPTRASYPDVGWVLAIAVVLAVGAGVSVAMVKEFYVGGVTSEHQLANVLDMRVAAVVPRVSVAQGSRALADQVVADPMSPFAEAFRKLRAGLDFGMQGQSAPPLQTSGESGRVILVTSALPEEGKSTVALSLARTYALAGKRTLLIDADLRQPCQHGFINAEPDAGLLDYLLGNGELATGASPQRAEPFYVQDPLTSLGLILGSRHADIPTDVSLQSEAFKALISNARAAFDVVILDSAPLLPVVDTQYLAPMVDGAIVCVRFGTSPQADLRAAVLQLRDTVASGAMIAAVLNASEGDGRRYKSGEYSVSV